jgi:hypothetical protein
MSAARTTASRAPHAACPAAGPGGRGRAVRALLGLLVPITLALGLPAAPSHAQGLDSLVSQLDAGSLFVGFSLPVRSLRAAGVEKALDEQGLSVDCEVSIEVRKKEGLLSRTVVKTLVRRSLSHSRWYDEYVLSENAREVATSKSYYGTLDRFRRFARMKVADLGTLDHGQAYTVRLEVSLVPRVAAKRASGASVVLAGVGAPQEMLELFKGRRSLLAIKVESASFTPAEVPRWSVGAVPEESWAVLRP